MVLCLKLGSMLYFKLLQFGFEAFDLRFGISGLSLHLIALCSRCLEEIQENLHAIVSLC